MKIIQGNIWSFWNDGYYIVIPTNGSVKKDGECVMGRGLALQAKQKFVDLARRLGISIEESGNRLLILNDKRLIIFPVKRFWFENASLDIIERSCKQLVEAVNMDSCLDEDLKYPVYLPKVGCGNGRLNWNEVKPILEKYLDDRFIVIIPKDLNIA